MTLIQAIGFKLGQKAAQAKNAFDLMGGDEEQSLQAEIRLGHDLAGAVLGRTPLMAENETTRFVAQIGKWLAAHVHERKLPFSFHVTAEPAPRAFALPGGPIFVSWPLVDKCQGERDEIAFLLAHEMAHIILRHTVDRLVQDAAVSLLLRQTSGRSAAAAWLNRAGGQVLNTAFSHDDELEADAFAAGLVAKAGGDPLASERLLEKLNAGGAGRTVASTEYLATHPPVPERIARLRAGSTRFSKSERSCG